ncbi:MHFG family PEP-CTERM protein, partial [Pelomonas sp. KK5]|uniref:MHFG family PEP-CTERM protein n=1 Tax=Pelomonas sp. KK5 TaxID=1855730 RepID=UPI0018E932B3
MGDVVAAVDRYQDIPSRTRDKLKARMARRDYDEIVSIKRDGIKGQATYGGDITDMYFGQGSVCRTVTRSKWTDAMEERGLVYCEDGQCILVPTVCRNVSRIRRMAPRPVAMAAATPPASADSYVAPPETELEMDPTGAGPGGASPTSFAGMAPPSLDSGLPASPGSLLPNTPGGGITPPAPILPGLPVLPPSVNT